MSHNRKSSSVPSAIAGVTVIRVAAISGSWKRKSTVQISPRSIAGSRTSSRVVLCAGEIHPLVRSKLHPNDRKPHFPGGFGADAHHQPRRSPDRVHLPAQIVAHPHSQDLRAPIAMPEGMRRNPHNHFLRPVRRSRPPCAAASARCCWESFFTSSARYFTATSRASPVSTTRPSRSQSARSPSAFTSECRASRKRW